MEKIIAFIFSAVLVLGAVLGIYWLMWKLWCWVLPQVWVLGPESVIRPGYWLFSGVLVLVLFILNIFRGSK